MRTTRHRCYRCTPIGADSYDGDLRKLDTAETTWSVDGDEVFFASGYGAREIAQKRARETNGCVYINNVSKKIRRPDMTVPVAYAVAKSPIVTLRGPDEWHETIYKSYWRPLE